MFLSHGLWEYIGTDTPSWIFMMMNRSWFVPMTMDISWRSGNRDLKSTAEHRSVLLDDHVMAWAASLQSFDNHRSQSLKHFQNYFVAFLRIGEDGCYRIWTIEKHRSYMAQQSISLEFSTEKMKSNETGIVGSAVYRCTVLSDSKRHSPIKLRCPS